MRIDINRMSYECFTNGKVAVRGRVPYGDSEAAAVVYLDENSPDDEVVRRLATPILLREFAAGRWYPMPWPVGATAEFSTDGQWRGKCREPIRVEG